MKTRRALPAERSIDDQMADGLEPVALRGLDFYRVDGLPIQPQRQRQPQPQPNYSQP